MLAAIEQGSAEPGCPIEIYDAVPDDVCEFANLLVSQRRLGAPFELPCLSVADTTIASLRPEFEAFSGVAHLDAFLDWTAHWIVQFGRFTQADDVRLKIVHARRPMCPRFHSDNVHMRFISALIGPGSEWLPKEKAKLLDDGYIPANADASVIQQIHPRSIGLFKGTAGQSSTLGGIIHRSPAGEADRVVVTMDIVR